MIWTLLIIALFVLIYYGFKECDKELEEFKDNLKVGDCFKLIDDNNDISIITILKINKEYNIVTYKKECGTYHLGTEELRGEGYFADRKIGDFFAYISLEKYKKMK